MEPAGIDYAFIRARLKKLYQHYPARIPTPWRGIRNDDDDAVPRHMCYMLEHGLIAASITRTRNGDYTISRTSITAKGIDFIQPDGGLSALAAPVIRIAPDSMIAIIDQALAARGITQEERSAIKKGLGIAGEEGIRAVVGKLVEAGIAYAPSIGHLFG